MKTKPDVIIVGAGPAGIGLGVLLKKLDLNFLILERDSIGSSFKKWPKEMRFISPSFPGNNFSIFDLNAITLDTSPAEIYKTEHLYGNQYANYLEKVSDYYSLPVIANADVNGIYTKNKNFILNTSNGKMSTRFVVWACGLYQYPKIPNIQGANLCIHNSSISSWEDLKGNDFIIIGGFESGIDGAIALSRLKKRSIVLDSSVPWDKEYFDQVMPLTPFTRDRLSFEMPKGLINLVGNQTVTKIEKFKKGYKVMTMDGREYICNGKVILATGFIGGLSMIKEKFEWMVNGMVFLNDYDESTLNYGLFVAGPEVCQQETLFYAIHRFRQRFVVVAEEIARRLGKPVDKLEEYKKSGFYIDDFSNLLIKSPINI